MSIQQFEKLITNAEHSAQWWKDNRSQVNAVVRKKKIAQRVLGGVAMVCCFGGVVATMWTASFPFQAQDGLYAVLSVFAGSLVTSTLLYGCIKVHFKICEWWPKHAPRPDNAMGVSIDLLNNEDPMDLHKRKEILQRIINHPSAAVRAYVPTLPQLQNLDLPDVWWQAVEVALNTIPTERSAVAVKTAQQQLDEVYIEIQQHTAHQNAPKVMKI